jgi:hypothetical protein
MDSFFVELFKAEAVSLSGMIIIGKRVNLDSAGPLKSGK